MHYLEIIGLALLYSLLCLICYRWPEWRRQRLTVKLENERAIAAHDDERARHLAYVADDILVDRPLKTDASGFFVESGDYPYAYEPWYVAIDKVNAEFGIADNPFDGEEIPTPYQCVKYYMTAIQNAFDDGGMPPYLQKAYTSIDGLTALARQFEELKKFAEASRSSSTLGVVYLFAHEVFGREHPAPGFKGSGWYWYDETGMIGGGPYSDTVEASRELQKYVEKLRTETKPASPDAGV